MAKKREDLDLLQEFYGISDDFPFEYLWFQQTELAKKVVLLNPGLHMLMVDCKKKYKMSPVNLGLKMFEKNRGGKSKAPYRLMQEGLELLLPHMDGTR